MFSNSAAFQQHRKLEIFDQDESPGFQDINDDLQEIIFSLHSSMFSAKFIKTSSIPPEQPLSESINYLRYLVSHLSKALSSIPEKAEPEFLSSNPSTFTALKRMMRAPAEGVYLKQSECREICGLLVGDIRDEEYNSLKQKLLDSQQKLVQYSKIILESRVRIEEREKELEELYDQVDMLNEEIKKSIRGSRLRSKISGGSTSASINLNIWPE